MLTQKPGFALIALLACVLACGSRSATAQSPDAPGEDEAPLPAGEPLQVFLLLGQSNMEGVPTPQADDRTPTERVWVLGYDDCRDRRWNRWSPASAPLHRCGTGVGPGDSFGRAMAAAWPQSNIGLVPAAISGVDVDFFRKGVVSKRRKEFVIPPDDKRDSAYDMVLERAKLAQQRGPIRAILWHQGESDNTSPDWVGKVSQLVSDLRTDLGLEVSVPFLAGELLYSGCCVAHNARVNELPSAIPNAHVISARGLGAMDQYHFDLAGQHELGRRYAEKFLELWPTP
jgi:Carbohydrate esterase, sialic acid-specific acetylesterase